MYHHLRTALYTLSTLSWTASLAVLFIPLLLLAPERRAGIVPRVWTGGVLFLARRICGIRAQVEGAEHIPEGAAIFALKHQSAWETFFLWHLLASPVFILKKELLGIPVFGYYLGRTPIIAIDRNNPKQALKDLKEQAVTHLRAGRQVVIFPEGTRLPPGTRGKYRSGVATLYAESGMPVIPGVLDAGQYWPKWPGVKRSGTITLRFLPPIAPGMEREAFLALLEEQMEAAAAELCA